MQTQTFQICAVWPSLSPCAPRLVRPESKGDDKPNQSSIEYRRALQLTTNTFADGTANMHNNQRRYDAYDKYRTQQVQASPALALCYRMSKPSERRHSLCASMKFLHSSSPFMMTQSSLACGWGATGEEAKSANHSNRNTVVNLPNKCCKPLF